MASRDKWTQQQRDTFNAQWRRWYRDNRERKKQWQNRRLDQQRQWWRQLKATKRCCLCGESTPECLHFHHIDPTTKSFDLSIAASSGWSQAALLAELEKCVVLCNNCHAKYHWEERNESG